MKKFFTQLFVAILTFTAFAAVAAEPEQFIHADAPAIFRLDCKRALERLTIALQDSKSERAAEFKAACIELKNKFNIELKDCFSGQAFLAVLPTADGIIQLFVKTNLPEKSFAEVFNAAIAQGNKNWQIIQQNNRNIYVTSGRNDAEKFAIMYLTGDVIMGTRLADCTAVKPAEKRNALLDKINKTSLFALGIDVSELPGNKKFSGVHQFNIDADLLGAVNSESIKLHADLQCCNLQTAQQLEGMFQFILPAFVSAIFSNDPELALQLATAIKVKRNDMQLNVDCLINEAMLKKADEYLNNPANGEIIERVFKGLKR